MARWSPISTKRSRRKLLPSSLAISNSFHACSHSPGLRYNCSSGVLSTTWIWVRSFLAAAGFTPSQFITSCSLGIAGDFSDLLDCGTKNSNSLWKCTPSSRISGSGALSASACMAFTVAPLTISCSCCWWLSFASSQEIWKSSMLKFSGVWIFFCGAFFSVAPALGIATIGSTVGSCPNKALAYQDFWSKPVGLLVLDSLATPLIQRPCLARVIAT